MSFPPPAKNAIETANSNLEKHFSISYTYGEKISSIDSINIGDYVVHKKSGIGIYKGITVVEYEDIARMGIKGRHHMKKTTNGSLRGRMSAGRAMYYALTDHYDEWDTYYIVIWTKNHRRFILTEVQRNDCESLIPIIKERCSNAESILKGI